MFVNKIKPNFIINFFSGHERSVKAKKNIIVSFGLKGFSIIIGFLLVPLTLNYLNPTKYGIWLTLSSIIGWFGFFDIGLGNGLRNKLTEALALNDHKLAKTYVSTTYITLSIIIGSIYILFLSINPFLNWSKILNTTPEMAGDLSGIALIVFTFFSLRFILKLIGVILTANQLLAYNNAFGPIGNFIAFISIYYITKFSHDNLLYVSVIYSAAPVIVLILASIFFFNGKYKYLKPSFKSVDFKYIKLLAGLGIKFFILQIVVLVVFTTDNMIITQILGPAEVTPYNIAYKYLSMPVMLFGIITGPYWSAYTDAITKSDIKWIKNSMNKLIKIWFLNVVGVIVLLAISQYFYLMWVGDKVEIPFILSAFMGLYAIIRTETSVFGTFINGVGKIKLQMYYGIIAMVINIPISVFFARNLEMGSAGVILGTCISLAPGFVLGPIQYFKIINNKATGIWNK